MIRVAASAGYQCGHPDTTVLCHPSISGLKAIGSRKASVPDIGAGWGCVVCHDLCDGRRRAKRLSMIGELPTETQQLVLQNALLEGVERTISALVKKGILPNP